MLATNLLDREVPGCALNVSSGAGEDGHVVVTHLQGLLQGGRDLQVQGVGLVWEWRGAES